MTNPQDPKDSQKNADDVEITNGEEKIVNKETENVHEATNQEEWAHDVNEQFGDDFILPEDEDAVKN
jgi:hypothetical protein